MPGYYPIIVGDKTVILNTYKSNFPVCRIKLNYKRKYQKTKFKYRKIKRKIYSKLNRVNYNNRLYQMVSVKSCYYINKALMENHA